MFRLSSSSPDVRSAFSLVELLVVLAILGIVAAFAVPALDWALRGTNLTRAGQLLGDRIALARQEAVTRSRDVRVGFYEGTDSGWQAFQIFRIEQDSTGLITEVPITKRINLPVGVVISGDTALSPLISNTGFRFRGNGHLERSINSENNFLTLVNSQDAGSPPSNYYTLQIHPLTGKVATYRP